MPDTRRPTSAISERDDAARQFLLNTLNNDSFVRTGKQIIDACELQIDLESWKSNVADLWLEVQALAQGQSDRVSAAYLIPRSGTVHIFLITRGRQFDFDLANALADLNVRLRRERGIYGDVEASQVPAVELPQFVREHEMGYTLAVRE